MKTSSNDTKDARSRILEAALDLFSEKGLEATTTLKIAKKAGVNEEIGRAHV
jgi:AcrR family transcriptional regulator